METQSGCVENEETQSVCKLIFFKFSIGLGDTNICFSGSVPNDDNFLTFTFSHSVPNDDAKFNYCWRSHIDYRLRYFIIHK